MPQQIFQVLRCYECQVFQVHQCKKAIKWECKICGEKQSRKRNYGIGTAKDCRGHVQRLNGIRGDIDESKIAEDASSDDEDVSFSKNIKNNHNKIKESKWKNYTEEISEKTSTVPEPNDTMYLDETEVVVEIPKKRPRKNYNKRSYNYKKKCSKYRKYNDCPEESDVDTEDNTDCVKQLEKHKVKFVPPTLSNDKTTFVFDGFVNNETENFFSNKSNPCYSTTIKLGKKEDRMIEDIKPHKFKSKPLATSVVEGNSKWTTYVDDGIVDQKDYDEEENEELYINSFDSVQDYNDTKENPVNIYNEQICNNECVAKSIDDGTNTLKYINQDDGSIDIDLKKTRESKKYSSNQAPMNGENLQKIFSLCDDNDLDDVLEF